MKVVLVALNTKYIHSNLAVYDLEAYAKEKINKEYSGNATEVEIVVLEFTINHNLDEILRAVYQEKADITAFACYIWNISEVISIAGELDKVSLNAHIWLGGPEVSYNSEELLEKYPFVDGIIRGEGEATFYELLCYMAGFYKTEGRLLSDIKGITYRDENEMVKRNAERALLSLDEVPFVYHDLSRFENKILYYESSRGCPFSCSYCLSSIDKTVRFRSFLLVKEELQYFLDNQVKQVKFVDRTFNCNREHSLAIWRYLAEHDNGVTNFHFEVSADLIGEPEFAVFEKMRPGLIQLEIGLQSTNERTLHEIHRVTNIDRVGEVVRKVRSFLNIHQHLDLIAGLPYEDFVTFKKSFNQAYEMKPDQLQLGFLKVLKGSNMEEQIQAYELRYQDRQPYEVLSTKWISYDEILLLKRVEELVEVYYNSSQFKTVLPYVICMFDTPYDFYESFCNYYSEYSLWGIGLKRETRYQVLRDFFIKIFGKENVMKDTFDSLLTFDYYLRENAKTRPNWKREQPVEQTVYKSFFIRGGNEQVSLKNPNYDSKAAAGKMHIETVTGMAVSYIAQEPEVKFCFEKDNIKADGIYYCLYDYENRSPLTKDGTVMILSHL